MTIKQKIMGESVQAVGNNTGFPQADAGSKDPSYIGNVKGGFANEGWERDSVKLNPEAANIADGTSNTSECVKVDQTFQKINLGEQGGGKTFNDNCDTGSGKSGHTGHSAGNTIGGATFNDGWMNTGGGSPPVGGANTIGGTAGQDDWAQQSSEGTPPANTIGGTAQDDWLEGLDDATQGGG